MLKISTEQLDAFRLNALQSFMEKAIQHLRRDMPEVTQIFTDAQLIQRVQTAMQRAQSYGLKTKREIMCFVDTSFLIGEHFDTDPHQAWARHLLTSKKLSSRDRANLLLATACSVHRDARSGRR